jgi:hypothetical protein
MDRSEKVDLFEILHASDAKTGVLLKRRLSFLKAG